MIVGQLRCIVVETGVRYVVDNEILQTDCSMLLFIRLPEGEPSKRVLGGCCYIYVRYCKVIAKHESQEINIQISQIFSWLVRLKL